MLRLYMFVKDTLEVQEGTSAIDHEDNIEAEETKNNDKKRKIMWFSCQRHVCNQNQKKTMYFVIQLCNK